VPDRHSVYLSARHRALRTVTRLGIDSHLRRASNGWRKRFGSANFKRNLRDEEQFALLCAAVLQRDSNAIDIGTNRGQMLTEIVRVAPEGHHLAYEPLPDFAADVRRRFPGVEVREAAMTNQLGDVDFIRVLGAPATSGLLEGWRPDAQIQRLRVRGSDLDSDLPPGYVPALIKIDVEGAELRVLEGARRTLDEHRPVVCFESFEAELSQPIHELFEDLGYRIFDMDGAGPLPMQEYQAMVASRARLNFVARPG
jgi:FkbM family methyltransferase